MRQPNMIYKLAANEAQKNIYKWEQIRHEIVMSHFEEVIDDDEFLQEIKRVNRELTFAQCMRNACIEIIDDDPSMPYDFLGECDTLEVPALVITIPLYDLDKRDQVIPLSEDNIERIMEQVDRCAFINEFGMWFKEVHKMRLPK